MIKTPAGWPTPTPTVWDLLFYFAMTANGSVHAQFGRQVRIRPRELGVSTWRACCAAAQTINLK
jgi:hypothetical protein